MTWFQIGYWKNSYTLYAHTLSVTKNNWLIHNNYGKVLEEQGRKKEATQYFENAMQIKPELPVPHLNLANNLYRLGKISEAEKHYKETIEVSNDNELTAKAHNRLAFIYQMQRKNSKAIKHYKEALRIKPDEVKALNNLAILYAQMGDFTSAAANFNRALEISPQDEETLNNLGLLSVKTGNTNKGIFYFKEALKYNPAYKPAQNNLARYMNSFQTKK
jgi:Tfp pilus assembly protein PilF